MKLSRPLAVLDLETTDAEPTACAIVEFAVTILNPDGTRKQWQKRFKPWKPISDGAAEVTGITNEMVADCPPFSDFAGIIDRSLKGKDLAGYNINSFDIVALDEELRRSNYRLDLTGVSVIDAFRIFQVKEPRDLTAAVKKYAGREHVDAHGAQADAEATADVLLGQLAMYDDLAAMSLPELAAFCRRDGREVADLAGKLYRKDGVLYYGFGKCRDVAVQDDPGFGWWMLRQTSPPFPAGTCEILRKELEGC